MSVFDDIIKQKADSHEAQVPPGAWDNISKKKRKRRFIFWWLLAALIIAGVGTPAYLYLKNGDGEKAPVIVQSSSQNNPVINQKEKSEGKEITVTEQNKSTAPTENIPSVVKEENKTAVAASDLSIAEDEKKQYVFTGNKIKVSKKAKTKASSQPVKISSDDLTVNKNISKKTPGKVSTEIINAAIDETNEDSSVKENHPEKNELTVTVNKTTTADKTGLTPQQENKTQPTDSATKKTVPATKKQSTTNKLFFDISFMPFMPFQQTGSTMALSRTTFENNVLSEFKATTVNTTLDPSVAFQFAIRKSINKKWFAGTGIQYMQLKETIKLNGEETTTTSSVIQRLVNENGQPVLIDDTVQNIVKGTREINAVNSYRFISIPLFMQYKAGKFAGLDLSVNAGLYFNIHSRYSNSINPLMSSQTGDAKNKTGIDVFAGIRFSKMYGRRIGLFAEPSARLTIKQANIKNTLTGKKIQQAGVSFGLFFKIK